ncbi:ArsR family transcriptional regulator [archaeon SCG-AAA382B04]|nr:ArsR family transcriptional regulator [archaeon SCG-AAA382B04]
MKKVLWWLIAGTRGGKNRTRIIKTLENEPMNANQLSKKLDLDYKTIRHHLEMLEENNVITSMDKKYGKTYFITQEMKKNLDILDNIIEKANLGG